MKETTKTERAGGGCPPPYCSPPVVEDGHERISEVERAESMAKEDMEIQEEVTRLTRPSS